MAELQGPPIDPRFAQFAGVDRETIWAGLFAFLQTRLVIVNADGTTTPRFVTLGRRHIQPPALPPEAQPACFVVQTREIRPGKPGGHPNMLTLVGYLILYATAPATEEAPGQETALAATTLNEAFGAIDDALVPDDPRGLCTLGGLVYHCALHGQVDQDPGIFTNQAAAILPIHMLVP